VPIALRISSHLLVGVVRIFARKVDYLFHDCSEALLKIHHGVGASNAVNLPPTALVAPYHAITMPETFDFDELGINVNPEGVTPAGVL
jgi:cohesin complex subunit SCC1